MDYQSFCLLWWAVLELQYWTVENQYVQGNYVKNKAVAIHLTACINSDFISSKFVKTWHGI